MILSEGLFEQWKKKRIFEVTREKTDKKQRTEKGSGNPVEIAKGSVKFEVFGNAMIEKRVRISGNSGRIYLPPDWVGHNVKIIRLN